MEKYAKDLERARSLRSRASASISDYDQVESSYLAAQAQYERAQQSHVLSIGVVCLSLCDSL